MQLLVIFDNFGPYHLARLAATRTLGEKEGISVRGLEAMATYAEYDWNTLGSPGRRREKIVTLSGGSKSQRALGLSAVPLIWRTLNRLRPDALAICGYKGVLPLAALLWAKAHGKIAIMMSESSHRDKARSALQEWGKRHLVRRFDAALVGGKSQKAYAALLGIPEERIYTGYDAVDNEHFSRGAARARQEAKSLRQELGLPPAYFLAVSRFIDKKNLPFLIEAYVRHRTLSRTPWDLVLCGSGPLEAVLREKARGLPGVHFPGFKQAQELPIYYGLASAFVVPSSHFEQWGLVVNEAMACGLPVLVSRQCGCAPDLVQEGVNGFTFDPRDVEALARLMARMSSGELNLAAMGEASRKIVSAYSPETFGANLLAACKESLEARGGTRPEYR